MVDNLGFIMTFLKHFFAVDGKCWPPFLKAGAQHYYSHPERTGRLFKPAGPDFLLKSFFFFHPSQKKRLYEHYYITRHCCCYSLQIYSTDFRFYEEREHNHLKKVFDRHRLYEETGNNNYNIQ
jgi:hypothetical protein